MKLIIQIVLEILLFKHFHKVKQTTLYLTSLHDFLLVFNSVERDFSLFCSTASHFRSTGHSETSALNGPKMRGKWSVPTATLLNKPLWKFDIPYSIHPYKYGLLFSWGSQSNFYQPHSLIVATVIWDNLACNVWTCNKGKSKFGYIPSTITPIPR